MSEEETTCTAIAGSCICMCTDPHEEHVCKCGGSWSGVADTDSFRIHSFPHRRFLPDGTVEEYSDAYVSAMEMLIRLAYGRTEEGT